jgi:tRNA-dihydrouridine synthase B
MPGKTGYPDHLIQLAPLAGITDYPMREMARRHGSGRTWTEMISSEALIRNHQLTWEMLPESSERNQVHVQLFGTRPETLSDACRIVEEAGAWGVDLNLGCPAPKIVKNGAGSALLKDLPKTAELVRAMRSATTLPLSLKIRSGWFEADRQMLLELIRMAEGEGVNSLCLHPRFREQQFRGRADWALLAWFVEKSPLPVIGSGDVTDGASARRMLQETGCQGVMIGRAVLGAPWIFSRIRDYFEQGADPGEPSARRRLETAQEHVRQSMAKYGPDRGLRIMRKHLAWYVKGIPDARKYRSQLVRVDNYEEFTELMAEIGLYLETLCEEV